MNKWLITAFILTLGVVGFAQTDVVKPVSDVGKIMPTILDTLDDSTLVVISPEGDTLVKPMPSPVEIDSTKDAIKLHKLAPLPADLLPPHRKGKRGAGGIVNHKAKTQNRGIETKDIREHKNNGSERK